MSKTVRILTVTLALATATAIAAPQKDAGDKAGNATEKALHKAGDGAEKGIEEAGEGVDEGLDATGKGVGAVVEHTTRGAVKTGKAIADFFDGDDDSDANRLMEAQRVLQARGYYRGAIDGIPGPKTRSGVREFQADNGLVVTGTINAKTADKLGI